MLPNQLASSYRDPAGFVFDLDGTIYRQINKVAREEFDLFISSGLYDALVAKGLIVSHTEVKDLKKFKPDSNRLAVIKPEPIPFISYPYEWSFPQLRDAALLTLKIQKLALEHGMILKDASAYNVQFIGKKPVFIDTLSFAKYEEGQAWEGYRQFIEHFLIPLAVAHFSTEQALTMLQTYMEGIPLSLAVGLLPKKAKFKKGLLAHVYLHERSQRKHQGSGTKAADAPTRKVSTFALNGLMSSLEASVTALKPPKAATEWGEYYEFTNYGDKAFKDKAKLVDSFLGQLNKKPQVVWDIGANNGEFSEIAAKRGAYVVAWDIDAKAVAANYQKHDKLDGLMLPLVQDVAVPSPAIGWELNERMSLVERGPADAVLALAVIHHLAIGRNMPLPKIASLMNRIGKSIIIEFIPKSDSKVKHLLASRKDIFPDYDIEHFEMAMGAHFKLASKKQISHSERWLYLYTNKKSV
ncbi:MAG: hypothetical protein JWO47_920 [Candidatus Saccharibacteria bacterium]|nr:hypothetical protein [Candidatus Saccharibacteria bacterium]